MRDVSNARLEGLIENLQLCEGFANNAIFADELRAIAAELLHHRQKQRPAKAGKKMGRPVVLDAAEIRQRVAAGERPAVIAATLGVSRSTVYRAMQSGGKSCESQ